MLGAALLGTFGVSSSAHAAASQNGTTSLTVTMPEFIVLSYYGNLGLTLTANNSTSASDAAYNIAWADTGTGDAVTTISGAGGGADSQAITLQNAWAIRGLAPTGKATVAIESVSSSLSRTSGVGGAAVTSTIAMSGLNVGYGGATSTSINAPLNGLSSGSATKGDVTMTLNFANTKLSGQHTGGSFKITATTI